MVGRRAWLGGVMLLLAAASVAMLMSAAPAPAPGDAGPQVIRVDGTSPGRVFEGIGALSAGASSRLVIDYPEPQRSQVLDLLFKPDFGAGFTHLKVEIGGDVNSTDGTEPSHMRAPDDEDYTRGYEWWLMGEARRRNPRVALDVLAWGAPGWVGGGRFFSQPMADYFAKFIRGARRVHGLTIQYAGIWNETPCDPEWIKLYRRTLDREGLGEVQIVASDQIRHWGIIDQMAADPELARAVSVAGVHYVGCMDRKISGYTSPEAIASGRRLWACEDGPWRGDWIGARQLAQLYNVNYIRGRCVKTIIWSLVSSYYDNLPLKDSGVIRANEPWSGHYDVGPALWATAHTTQFARPGWAYIDSACVMLSKGGSCVALRSADSQDYTLVIETGDATEPQPIAVEIGGGLSERPLVIWKSDARRQFIRDGELQPQGGRVALTLAPDSLYTLTTLRTGQKGGFAPVPHRGFPADYRDDFERSRPGQLPRYFSDQAGVFEVAAREDGRGNCLRQVIPQLGIEWHYHYNPDPETFLGDHDWENYTVSVQARPARGGYAAVFGRVGKVPQRWGWCPPPGYCLKLYDGGTWEIRKPGGPMACGQLPATVDANAPAWHAMRLQFQEDRIIATIDGDVVADVRDDQYRFGQAGLGSSWAGASFDDFAVRQEPHAENLARWQRVRASSEWTPTEPIWIDDQRYDASSVTDGQPALTRWSAAAGQTKNQWLEIEFERPTAFSRTIIRQFEDRVTAYRIQAWDGLRWIDVHVGGALGTGGKEDRFRSITATKLRLMMETVRGSDPASIWEIEVYRD